MVYIPDSIDHLLGLTQPLFTYGNGINHITTRSHFLEEGQSHRYYDKSFKSRSEIEAMRRSGKAASTILQRIGEATPAFRPSELDQISRHHQRVGWNLIIPWLSVSGTRPLSGDNLRFAQRADCARHSEQRCPA